MKQELERIKREKDEHQRIRNELEKHAQELEKLYKDAEETAGQTEKTLDDVEKERDDFRTTNIGLHARLDEYEQALSEKTAALESNADAQQQLDKVMQTFQESFTEQSQNVNIDDYLKQFRESVQGRHLRRDGSQASLASGFGEPYSNRSSSARGKRDISGASIGDELGGEDLESGDEFDEEEAEGAMGGKGTDDNTIKLNSQDLDGATSSVDQAHTNNWAPGEATRVHTDGVRSSVSTQTPGDDKPLISDPFEPDRPVQSFDAASSTWDGKTPKELQDEVDALEKQLDEQKKVYQKQLDDQKKEYAKLDLLHKALEKKFKELQVEWRKKWDHVNTLTAEMKKLKEEPEKARLEQELGQAKQERDGVQQTLEQKDREIDRINKEWADCYGHYKAADAFAKNQNAEFEELKKQLSQQQATAELSTTGTITMADYPPESPGSQQLGFAYTSTETEPQAPVWPSHEQGTQTDAMPAPATPADTQPAPLGFAYAATEIAPQPFPSREQGTQTDPMPAASTPADASPAPSGAYQLPIWVFLLLGLLLAMIGGRMREQHVWASANDRMHQWTLSRSAYAYGGYGWVASLADMISM